MKKAILFTIIICGIFFKTTAQVGFQPHIITEPGNINGPTAVFAADLDGDGHLDLVSVFRENKISWFENINGSGVFGPENIITTNVESARMVVASDLDGDGDLDIITTTVYDNKTVWFENLDGQGTFGPERIIDVGISSLYSLYGFDVDGDGDNDIIASKSGVLIYYENLDGQGNFSEAIPLITDNVNYFVLNDLDGDGKIDIVANAGDAELAWYKNLDGLGNFGDKQTIADTGILSYLNMADIDGNGSQDIMTLVKSKDKISWYRSIDGQGTFSDEIVLSTTPAHPAQGVYDLHAVDIDGDGFIDAVSANSDAQTITWFKNLDGQGDFGPARIVSENNVYLESIFPVDLDGDGYVDILANSDENGFPTWYKNIDGLGNFEVQPPLSTDTVYHTYVYAADLDGDGDMDIIVGGSEETGIVWFENLDGLGNFGPARIVDSEMDSSESIYTADLDGDGHLDIVAADYYNGLFAWYRNLDGQGNFSPRIIIEENVSGSFNLYPADLDGDGDVDIIGTVINEDLLVWYENDGQGNFGPRQIIAENIPAAERIRVFDADQDGDLDILISDPVERTFSWFENTDGLGTFGPRQLLDANMNGALAIATADIDGNGTIDILTGSFRGDTIKWFENFGVLGNDITGNLRLDLDANGCTDSDAPMRNIMVVSDNGTHSFATFSQPNGDYQIYTNEGSFTTAISSELPTYWSPDPLSHTSIFTGQNNSDTADFCVTPTEVVNDLNVALYPLSDARPSFEAEYQVVYNNVGTSILNGEITIHFDDDRLDFLNASEPVDSQTNNSVTINYADFRPFETRSIDLRFQVAAPPTTEIDDILTYNLTIEPLSGDLTEADNTFTFNQVVIGSFDPNDIQVLEGESIFIDEADDYLHYIIRFQNMGTASAINVRVANELDPNLNWTTLQIENISHPNRVEITDSNQVEFIFNNINLPDATSNEPESHGYIQYKIKPKSNISIGDFMQNSAAIYFDFNLPVITNTVITTVVEPLGVEENVINAIALYPIPSRDVLNIKSDQTIVEAVVFNELGQLLFTVENPKGIQNINIEQLSTGMYFVRLTDGQQNSSAKKFIKLESLN